jgi:hypothetical protein
VVSAPARPLRFVLGQVRFIKGKSLNDVVRQLDPVLDYSVFVDPHHVEALSLGFKVASLRGGSFTVFLSFYPRIDLFSFSTAVFALERLHELLKFALGILVIFDIQEFFWGFNGYLVFQFLLRGLVVELILQIFESFHQDVALSVALEHWLGLGSWFRIYLTLGCTTVRAPDVPVKTVVL